MAHPMPHNTLMVDPVQLINIVEKYPCLWKVTSNEYNNKTMKQATWAHVTEKVVKEYRSLSVLQKKIKIALVKKRWYHLRESYRRDLRQCHPRDKPKYIYSDLLTFLNMYLPDRTKPITSRTKVIPVESEDEEMTTADSAKEPPAVPPDSKLSNFERSIISALNKRSYQDHKDGSDPDLMFLRSLLPDLQQLTPQKMQKFKIGVFQLFKNVRRSAAVASKEGTELAGTSLPTVASSSSAPTNPLPVSPSPPSTRRDCPIPLNQYPKPSPQLEMTAQEDDAEIKPDIDGDGTPETRYVIEYEDD